MDIVAAPGHKVPSRFKDLEGKFQGNVLSRIFGGDFHTFCTFFD